jgi:DNA-binding NtrC family response regulator
VSVRTAAGAADAGLPGFLACDPRTKGLVELACRAATRAPSVLVTGESGTGKSRLARAMHDLARGPAAPFVIVDCAGLPEELAENELFGHEAGAYSGATSRQAGKFETAHGGTVVLDRIAELPLEMQGKLLRVLQDRELERVGGHVTIRVDVLVLATSSQELLPLVREGRFREDLFYRLDVVHLVVPPLRDRPGDVLPLAELFLRRCAERLSRALDLPPAAARVLQAQPWPGNVRQLENLLERVAVSTDAAEIRPSDLEAALEVAAPSPDRAVAELASSRLRLDQLERLYVQRVIEGVGGRLGEAARVLGIHRKTLLEKRKRWGLP